MGDVLNVSDFSVDILTVKFDSFCFDHSVTGVVMRVESASYRDSLRKLKCVFDVVAVWFIFILD